MTTRALPDDHDTTATSPLLLSVEAAAPMLSVSRSIVFREIKAGRLRSVKVGKRRLIPRDALDEFIATLEAEAAAAVAGA